MSWQKKDGGAERYLNCSQPDPAELHSSQFQRSHAASSNPNPNRLQPSKSFVILYIKTF